MRRTTRRGRRRRRAAPTGAAPIAARSLTLTSTPHQPAHSGSRSTIDGQDRVARRDEVAARHRGAVVADVQARARQPGDAARRAGPWWRRRASANRPDRPAHAHVRAARRPSCPGRRCQPRRANSRLVARPGRSASNRSTPAASARAHAARTSAAPTRTPARRRAVGATTRRLPVHQPRSGRDASGSTGASRTPPSTSPAPSRATSTIARGSWSCPSRSPAASSRNRPCSSTKTARRSARWATTSGWRASIAGASVMVTSWGRRRARPAEQLVGRCSAPNACVVEDRHGPQPPAAESAAARAARRAAGGLVGAAHAGGHAGPWRRGR